jgi:hypothetical protein
MKYLINESKLVKLIGKYIEARHPEVMRVEREKAWHQGKGHYADIFSDPSQRSNVFIYWLFNPYDDESAELYPELQLNGEIFNDIESVFGEDSLGYVIEWFNKTFGLEAQSITF